MMYEKHIIWHKRGEKCKKQHFVENKMENLPYVLK